MPGSDSDPCPPPSELGLPKGGKSVGPVEEAKLKPRNWLVEAHDVAPVVKVIDFGIAKAMGQQLTDKTVHTSIAQMIGTPLYVSPEQAGLSSLDVDTVVRPSDWTRISGNAMGGCCGSNNAGG